MATDGPTPAPCDKDIFKNGQGICVLDGSSNAIERWVQTLAKKTDSKIDWHYSGGRANVLHLGDEESRLRVIAEINDSPAQDGIRILGVGGPSLYRNHS